MQTPARSAAIWASSDVPTPYGTIGTRCELQILTIAATSSVEAGYATASGGDGA